MPQAKPIEGILSNGDRFECKVAIVSDFLWAQKQAGNKTNRILPYLLTRVATINGTPPIYEEILEMPFGDFGRLTAIAQGDGDPQAEDDETDTVGESSLTNSELSQNSQKTSGETSPAPSM